MSGVPDFSLNRSYFSFPSLKAFGIIKNSNCYFGSEDGYQQFLT